MRIAYSGPGQGTSLHRASALKRLGHEVTIIDPWEWLGRSKWVSRWAWHTGGLGFEMRINRPLLTAVFAARPALIFVNQGEFLGPVLLRRLGSLNVPIVNYTNDNPFAGRDGMRFRLYRDALPRYSLLAIAREESLALAKRLGARDAMRVWYTADEKAHRPRLIDPEVQEHYASEVSFIGTWMPERGPFMAELIRRGVSLSIWGDRWQKAPEWQLIAPHWRGPGIYDDDRYAAAILSARICLGLLSKGNRDLHTSRSIEIPALGGLLCAERTSEHLVLYEEGREAVFWKDAQECAAVCKHLLEDEPLRQSIARSGHERALRNNHFNEPMLAAVIERAMHGYGARR